MISLTITLITSLTICLKTNSRGNFLKFLLCCFNIELITGKSPKLQHKIIHQILTKHDFNYYIPKYNTGVMYITDTRIN